MTRPITKSQIEVYQSIGVDDGIKLFLEGKATNIRKRMETFAQTYFEVGQELYEAKEVVPHGKFKIFVEKIVGLNMRTAEQAMHLYNNFKGGDPELLNKFTLSAAAKISRKTFPDEVRNMILEDARKGNRITESAISRYLKEPLTDDDKSLRIKAQIHKEIAALHRKRATPISNLQSYVLPPEVTCEPIEEETAVKLYAENSVGMYIAFLTDVTKHKSLISENMQEQIARTLMDHGSLVIICLPELLQYVYYSHSNKMEIQAQIISTLSTIDVHSGTVVSSGYLSVLWLTKNGLMPEQQQILNLILSDAEIEEGIINFGINEAAYMLDKIVIPGERIVNIYPLSGQIAEAAYAMGKNIHLVTGDAKEVADTAWRLSGYGNIEDRSVEDRGYAEEF